MKTIEQAARESADKAWGELDEFTSDKDGEFYYQHTEAFKAGVEFAQRWIPVTEDIPDENYKGYVNFKIGDYVSCKKVDSQIEFLNLIDVYGFTHWRPIEYK